ncbi:holo-ACP synthase [Kamptonema cortianum]|nr:holo-ACP synthase [Kamptonema cortianum]MDL5049752.1 holo-ACP synthase [Oscillatoria amoena NRMC-F 0135]
MKILGTGLDLVEIERITAAMDRHGQRFLQRIFTSEELAYCEKLKFPEKHLAARFAAKEAVAKAFGAGIGGALGWLDISVGRNDSGKPAIIFSTKAQALCRETGVTDSFLSLTHTDTHAAASVILTGE